MRLNSARASCLAALVWLALAPATGAEPALRAPGGLRGSVTDPSGAAVPGASVEARAGARARTRTDAAGEWTLPELPAGAYRVTVSQPGFARFEREGVKVVAGQTVTVDAELAVARVRETVDVREGREGAARAGGLVLEGALLDALPDDPGEMLAALAALAGAAPGHAPPVLVDGFEGGRVPPKAAIRMVRLNASPYSAEYEYPGLGRIEIFTKPGGGDGVHGSAQARLGGKALDARDPFASGETPDYRRLAGGAAVGGPLVPGRASFFLDLERAASDEARLVNALVLGPGLVPASRNESFVAALTRTTVSPRFDAQVGGHTLTARYAYSTTVDYGAGVGAFALPSRAFTNSSRQHLLQAGDTFSLGPVTHELRAQWSRQLAGQEPEGVGPSLVVEDAFASGGAAAGPSRRTHDRFELHDVLAWASGAHGLRAGVRLRRGGLRDESRAGWSGTVTFGGGVGPALDAGGRAVLDAAGRPVLAPLTSLERYRRTLALRALGLSPAEVRELGGGASLLEVAGGEARASVGQWDLAAFVQDEWRVREDLTLGLGRARRGPARSGRRRRRGAAGLVLVDARSARCGHAGDGRARGGRPLLRARGREPLPGRATARRRLAAPLRDLRSCRARPRRVRRRRERVLRPCVLRTRDEHRGPGDPADRGGDAGSGHTRRLALARPLRERGRRAERAVVAHDDVAGAALARRGAGRRGRAGRVPVRVDRPRAAGPGDARRDVLRPSAEPVGPLLPVLRVR